MRDNASITYAPINTLKRVAEGVWIVDGPVIRFGWVWPKFRFSTRMTVVRLASGVLHSPTQLTRISGALGSPNQRPNTICFSARRSASDSAMASATSASARLNIC
jgi:hypothetical protein